MLFDLSTYIGHWPFRKIEISTLDELSCELSDNLTDCAAVTNLNSVFYRDCMEGNIELTESLGSYVGRVEFYPFAVINPIYIEWKTDLKKCAELGFKGVEIAPGYHKYAADCPSARELYRLCGELGLVFKVAAGFENIRGRNVFDTFYEPTGEQLFNLISSSEKTSTVICGYYNYDLGDALRAEATRRDNVLFDISCLDDFNNGTLSDTVRYVGEKRMCYASTAPFRLIEPQQIKLFSGTLSDEGVSDVAYKNALRIFNK
ncbi:MAG: amidohydrolase family protein [Firmicutes bacterium]|nr:amidohydrolase family protein [Bacillota bacterium]